MVYGTLVTIVAVAAAGWTAHEVIPTRADISAVEERVIIAGSKADIALDRQMEAMIAAIARLQAKPHKSPEDIAQLNYLRQQLDILRKARAGK